MCSKNLNLLLLSTLTLTFYLIGVIGAETEVVTEGEPAKQLLKVQVYYETLCPDSMQFIRNQLYYAMVENDWLQHTDLVFIPYGKVTSWTNPATNVTILYCQHGNTECELNALHACIVENNNVEEQLKLINCLMRGYSTNVDQCASSLKIDVSKAKSCKASRSTPDILRKYGEATDAIDISFVPSIALDNEFNPWEQRSILYDFDKSFCKKYKEKYNITLKNCN